MGNASRERDLELWAVYSTTVVGEFPEANYYTIRVSLIDSYFRSQALIGLLWRNRSMEYEPSVLADFEWAGCNYTIKA